MSAGHRTASPAATRRRSPPTSTKPPPSMTQNHVVFGFVWASIRPRRAIASSATSPRPSEWITWPSTPRVPAGPSGRRWPTPNRRTSIGMGDPGPPDRPDLAPPTPAARLRPDRRLGPGELRLREVALPGELLFVDGEQRWESEEPRVQHRPDADRDRRQDDEEVEREDRGDDEQEAADHRRPEEPLPQVEVGRMTVEHPRPPVVQDDRGHDEDQADRPDRLVQVRKRQAAERLEEVLPGEQRHVESSVVVANTGWSVREYAMSHGILGRDAAAPRRPSGATN